MVHVIICMHSALLEALCELSEQLLREPIKARRIGYALTDEEREIYQQLDEAMAEIPNDEPVLILGDQLGSRSATVSMSIPHPHVTFLGGVNLSMMLELNAGLEGLEELEISHNEQVLALTERLCIAGKAGVVDSHSYLRPEGEDSQIDSSYYEGSVFGLSSMGSSHGDAGSS